MFKTIVILYAMVMAGFVNAQGWTGELNVESVMTEGLTDLIIIKTSGITSADATKQYAPGCVSNQWIFKSDATDRRNRAYSTAMAALASGKKIHLWFADNCTSWEYHQATSIQMIK